MAERNDRKVATAASVFRAVVALLILCLSVSAAAGDLNVNSQQPSEMRASPREILYLSYRLVSSSPNEMLVVPRLDAPVDWSPIVPMLPVRLAPGGSAVLMVHLRLPDQAAAGRHDLRLRLENSTGAVLAPDTLTTVEVEANTSVDLEFLEVPEWVVAGQEIQIRLATENRSNIPLDLAVAVETRPPVDVSGPADTVEILAGETIEIAFSVMTDSNLARVRHQSVVVRLLHDSETLARIATDVRVVPRGETGQSTFESIPAEISLGLLSNQLGGGMSMQLAARGAGNFGRGGRRHLAFDFVGPSDTSRTSSLGRRDEFSLSYKDSNLEVGLGDGGFSLSPLVEQGRWGRGVRARYLGDTWSVGGFVMRDRFSDFEEFALFAEVRPTKSTGLSFSLLEKREVDIRRLAGVQLWFANENYHAALEIARNLTSGRSGSGGYRASAGGQRGRLSFGLETFRTDPGFDGYFADRDLDHLRLAFSLDPLSQIWASYRHDQSFASERRPTHPAPEVEEMRVGVDRRFGQARMTLSAHSRDFTDRQVQPSYSNRYRSVALALGLSHRIGEVHVNASLERGEFEDLLAQRADTSIRASIDAAWHPGSRGHVFAGARYEKNYLQLDDSEISLVVGGSTSLNANIQIRGEVQGIIDKNGPEARIRRQHFLQLAIDWANPWGHNMMLMVRESARDSRPAVVLSYSIPIRVPVHRRDDRGSIRGRVVEKESGHGVPDAVVTVAGLTAVSDKDGSFVFRGLPVGSHQLLVDLGPQGVRWMALETPRTLVVSTRGNPAVHVEVIESATIRGRIELWQAPEGDLFSIPGEQPGLRQDSEPVLVGGVGQVLVSLRNGSISVHRLSGPDGRFVFSGIPPGRWRLSVKESRLPPHTRIEKGGVHIEVGPGGTREISLRVVPKVRGIKIQGGGALKVRTVPRVPS